MNLFLQVYGTNKSTVEGFGGSTPNLLDANTTQDSVNTAESGPKKSKSGIVFGASNISQSDGKRELSMIDKNAGVQCYYDCLDHLDMLDTLLTLSLLHTHTRPHTHACIAEWSSHINS